MKQIVLITCVFIAALSSQAQNKKIKVGASPVLTTAGVFLAQEKGYFKEEGLDVEISILKSSGGQMTLLLSKGDLDVGAGNLTAGLYNAINEGLDFKIVADKGHVNKDIDSVALIIRKDLVDSGKYKELKDLKGLKIALTSIDGSSQQIVMDEILKKAGLQSKDIEYVKLSYPESNVALKAKVIDGVIQLDPYLTMALTGGYGSLVMPSNQVLTSQQSGAIFYSPQFMKNNPIEAVKFMKAYLKGVRLYNSALKDQTTMLEVVDLLKKHIKIEDENLWLKLKPVGLKNNGSIDKKSIRSDLKWYNKNGYLSKIPEEKDYLNTEFAKKASLELDKNEKLGKRIKNKQ